MIHSRSYTLATIDDHLRAVDETALMTGKVQTHIRHIIWVGQPAEGHIPDKLLTVLRCVLHASEHGK